MPAPIGRRARGFQLGAYVEMVVDLAVESDRQPPAIAAHRLRAGLRQLDDREPAVPERDAGGGMGPQATGVRSTMRQRIRHTFGYAGKQALVSAAGAEQACYAAHVMPHMLCRIWARASSYVG